MTTRRAIALIGLVLALGVLAPATALGKAGGTDRPVRGHSSGTTVLDLGTLAFTVDATGVISHGGKSTSHFDGVLTFTGPDTFDVTGSVTITTANGDELFGTVSGSGTTDASGDAQGTNVITYTGGTGRFENASGTASAPFTQVLISTDGTASTFATESSLRGTVSY